MQTRKLTQIPESPELESWLSPAVLSCYREGKLRSFFHANPYVHYVVPNLFRPEVFEELRRMAEIDSRSDLLSHPAKYGFKAAGDQRLCRFLYGREWRNFVFELTGIFPQVCKEFPYPQIYRFAAQSKGLGRHTDYGSGRDLATLFYLNADWTSTQGGLLALYGDGAEPSVPVSCVEPIPNTFVALPIFEQSWHAVQAMCGDWERITLILDYAADPVRALRSPSSLIS